MPLCSMEEALEDLKAGKFIIVVDDEHRENEGDLVMPADACDFARYCAGVDFFSMNDHAEALTPERWRATIESIRECNARAGEPLDPDLVAFMGYEWTQAGATPETHYGHKNVIFRGLADDELPARPITSLPQGTMGRARGIAAVSLLELLPRVGGGYADFLWWIRRMAETPDCELGVDSKLLPDDCRENASTAAELFEKLRQGELDPLVIPHGLAWGVHAPPGARLDNQLTRAQHGPVFAFLDSGEAGADELASVLVENA